MFVRKYFFSLIVAGSIVMPAAAAPEHYTIDPSHTYPSLEFSHMGISMWRGKFNNTTGKATVDFEKKTGNVEIEIDTASIDFGMDKMNEHASSEDWLNVKKYPTMTYKGKLIFTGDKPTAADGELTLLGVTKPVKLKLNSFDCLDPHPFLKKKVCGTDAEGTLNRADFGLDKYTDNGMGIIHMRIQAEAVIDKPAAE